MYLPKRYIMPSAIGPNTSSKSIMKSTFRAFITLLTTLVLSNLFIGQTGHAASDLFSNATADEHRFFQLGTDSEIVRRRLIHINHADLAHARHADAHLRLNLFEDTIFDAAVEQMEQRSDTNYTLSGHVNGDPFSTFSLSVFGDVLAMNIRTSKGELYQVRSLQNGVHEARLVNQDKFPECGVKAEHAIKALPAAADVPAQSDTGDMIDVMVVYTPAAKNAAGGTNAIMAAINLAIAESNVAYQQSQITTRVRLVYAGEVSYTEAGFSTDLTRITNPSDGYLDEVHTLRNTYGADLVSFWINDTSSCGLAWLMTSLSPSFAANGFSVVHWGPQCATGYYSFGHEMGHNMGCAHDRENSSGQGLYSYSYGWRFTGTNGVQYRTIMGYAPGIRIQRFSNPDVSYFGTPTGVAVGTANESHNAQSINNAAFTVANFRATAVSTNTPPSISIQPQSQAVSLGDPVSFYVTASGTEPMFYFWRKGGVAIAGANSSSYTIPAVQSSDTNVYSVIVSNAFGFILSSNASLTISTQVSLGSAVDNTGFSWLTGGTANWAGQSVTTHDGVDAAQSGTITDDGFTQLQTTVEGPGTLRFWWKVSSEANYDWLDVFLDGSFLDPDGLSGEVNWTYRTFSIPSGSHTLTWQYSKDYIDGAGQDKAWVDQISYVAASSITPTSLVMTNKQFRFSFDGLRGASYTLQASSNLNSWTNLTTVVSSTTSTTFQHTGATNSPTLFYRVVSP